MSASVSVQAAPVHARRTEQGAPCWAASVTAAGRQTQGVWRSQRSSEFAQAVGQFERRQQHTPTTAVDRARSRLFAGCLNTDCARLLRAAVTFILLGETPAEGRIEVWPRLFGGCCGGRLVGEEGRMMMDPDEGALQTLFCCCASCKPEEAAGCAATSLGLDNLFKR